MLAISAASFAGKSVHHVKAQRLVLSPLAWLLHMDNYKNMGP